MLHIRPEQMDALNDYMLSRFENRAYAHLVKCWPKQCAGMDENTVRASIRDSIDRAAHYGITTKRDIIRFLDVMYALSQNFDTDRRVSWAQEILNDSSLPPGQKMYRIWEKTKQTLKTRQNLTY